MKKFLKISAISIAALLLLALLLPLVFQQRISALVKQEINNAVNATVDYGRVSASFFRHFPSFTLTIRDISVVGKDEFDEVGLFSSGRLSVTINLRSLLRGSPYEVERIGIDRAKLHLLVLENGKANWDIAKSDTTAIQTESAAEEEALTVKLNAISVSQSDISYEDRELVFSTHLSSADISLSGEMSLDQALLDLRLTAANLRVDYDGMKLLDGVSIVFDGDVDAGLATDIYMIRSRALKLNALGLGFEGKFDISGQNIGMDFTVEAPNGNFKDLLSIVPAIYSNNFKDLQASGHFDFKAGMAGEYGDKVFPSYFMRLNVRDGAFAYPSLPSKLERFNLDLALDNPTGADNDLKLDVSRLTMAINGQPFEGRLAVRQMVTDPEFKAGLNGIIDLKAISGLLPAGVIPEMEGRVSVAFTAAARMKDIEAQRYQNVDAQGNIELSALRLPDIKPGIDLGIGSAKAQLGPETSRLEVNGMKLGVSDFRFEGQVSNYLSYLLSDGELKGSLNLNADFIDANELLKSFMSSETSAAVNDTSSFQLELPERLNLSFMANVGRLTYEQYELKDVEAGLRYVDKKLTFNPLNAKLLGGKIQMQGSFDGGNAASPFVDLDFRITDFDIPTSYQTIGLFSMAAPVAEKTKGRFSTGFRLKGQLNESLQPVLSTLQGGGGLQSSRISIESVNVLNQLADRLGNEDLRRIESDGVNISFEFLNGRVFQKPFSFGHSGIDATLAGSIGFDQTLDYDLALSVPFEKLGAEANQQLQKVLAQAAGRGINLAAGSRINIRAKIGGTATSPTIAIDYRDYAANLRNELMQSVAAELEKQKEQLRTQARDEANKLIEQAQRQADELIRQAENTAAMIRNEASSAADRLRREADGQAEKLINEAKGKGMLAEMGAQEGARKIRQQAATSAARVEQEADQRANAVVSEARRQADKLLEDARARATQL
ncbi:MAG TPA: AsmA-like C-terminal region-containing protein [Bacteroidales bacterium]|nr:AsmA-like C-terminal region-containing protein [Bacteroidales bacterium]